MVFLIIVIMFTDSIWLQVFNPPIFSSLPCNYICLYSHSNQEILSHSLSLFMPLNVGLSLLSSCGFVLARKRSVEQELGWFFCTSFWSSSMVRNATTAFPSFKVNEVSTRKKGKIKGKFFLSGFTILS